MRASRASSAALATSSSALPGRGDDGGRDGALDERRVGEPHRAVAVPSSTWRIVRIALPRSPRTSDAVAAVGAPDRVADEALVGAERAVRAAAGGSIAHLVAGHLAGQLGDAASEVRAVRHDYDPDHAA